MEPNVMKFQQIKIGQKFEYQGNTYVKSSPLVASHTETGEQKLIPRYAAIVVTDTPLTSADKKPASNLNTEQVQIAFDKFYDCYLDSLQKVKPEIEAQALKSFQNKLDNARQRFLNELGLQD
jgi:hypothetical protein